MLNLKVLFRVTLSILAGLFLMGITLDFTNNDYIIFLAGVLGFILMWLALAYNIQQPNKPLEVKEEVNSKTDITWWETEDHPYRFIFTHEEAALDAIEKAVANHPKVKRVAQDSGNWYTNGETGPEWFSMHVTCKREDADEVQDFVRAELKKRNYSYQYIKYSV